MILNYYNILYNSVKLFDFLIKISIFTLIKNRMIYYLEVIKNNLSIYDDTRPALIYNRYINCKIGDILKIDYINYKPILYYEHRVIHSFNLKIYDVIFLLSDVLDRGYLVDVTKKFDREYKLKTLGI